LRSVISRFVPDSGLVDGNGILYGVTTDGVRMHDAFAAGSEMVNAGATNLERSRRAPVEHFPYATPAKERSS